jgi:excinuclease ABC subunit A
MTTEEASEFFSNIPHINEKFKSLCDVGLNYIKIGQNATTLSGGEAQRIKLAKELSRKATGDTLYILDEPTTGLHFEDINRLLGVLHKLVDAGNSILVIEHNIDVLKTADWIIDVGPFGGNKGGYIVAEGTPEEIAKNSTSVTGKYLLKYFP